VLARWAANAQAFVLLRNANLMTDAYGIARTGSELAIRVAWASEGVSERFPSPAARVEALIEDANHALRVWHDKMHARRGSGARPYDDTTDWGRRLMAAKEADVSIERMADCAEVTKDMYAFAFRGESGAVHSSARVLVAQGEGIAPIPEELMLHNVLVAAMVIFGAVAKLIEDRRAADMANRLQQAIKDRVAAKTRRGA
jgi:hypothetical protein